MKTKPINTIKSEINITHILQYLNDNVIYLNLPNILTLNKTLKIGMPYLFNEGQRTFAIRLLHLWDEDEFAYLKVQELKNGRVYTISCRLEHETDYYMWSVASLDYLMTITKKSKKRGGTC